MANLKFTIRKVQILDEKGSVKGTPPDSKIVKEMYEKMVLSRVFDDKCLKLQRQGRMGTYASSRGQEAAQIGTALAMKPKDWVFPSFRESGVFLARGVPGDLIMQYWSGDERGSAMPGNNFPVSIPVATQIPHAAGTGWALKLQKKKAASIVYFGDGASSEGDFHEGLNFAGVYKANTVFVCQNNQWAISLPFAKQTASATVAQKAIGYGFEGVWVDGNDVFAVYQEAKKALQKARLGKGPTLLECATYRMGDHTTADDAKRYRSGKEVEAWKKKDPIKRLEAYMKRKKLWNPAYGKKVLEQAQEIVEEFVEKEEGVKPQVAGEIFRNVFEKPTPELQKQAKEVGNG